MQTHAVVDPILISMKIAPRIIRLYMDLVWLLHRTFMVSSSSVTMVSLKIFKVFISLPHFISSFHHLYYCQVGPSKYNLGFTDYKKEAELKSFSAKGTEVRSRATAQEKLQILLLCPNHRAGPF